MSDDQNAAGWVVSLCDLPGCGSADSVSSEEQGRQSEEDRSRLLWQAAVAAHAAEAGMDDLRPIAFVAADIHCRLVNRNRHGADVIMVVMLRCLGDGDSELNLPVIAHIDSTAADDSQCVKLVRPAPLE